MKKISLLLLSILLTGATFAQEAVLTAWTFDNLAPSNDTSSTPLTIASNTDIGIQTGTAMIYADGTNGSSALSNAAINPQITSFSGNVMNDPRSFQSAGKALALASNSTNGKAIVFKFSTTGYQNAVITYATRGTATGFTQHAWAYSTDGVNFTSFTTLEAVTTDAWAVKTIDFSTITALNNAQNVYLQLTVTGATNATGNNRIDNFVVKAVPAGPDVYAPKIADFEVVTPTSLAITFNEPVTAATAEVATNYVLTGYNVTTATLANQVDITLTISPALVEGESYSLTVTNITDLAGNEMTDSTFSFTYGVASEFVVNSIAELRAKWTAPLNPDALTFGDIEYKLAGEVIVTAINDSYRNQKFIQDATGALVIDDQTGMIRTLDIGDKVTNFYGTLTDYYGLLQLVVTRDCSPVISPFNEVAPLDITLSQLQSVEFMNQHQSELIRIKNVTFTSAGTFANGSKYGLTDGTNTVNQAVWIHIYNIPTLTGTPIPTTMKDVTGVNKINYGSYLLIPRSGSDISQASDIENITMESNIQLYPNPASDVVNFVIEDDAFNANNVQIFDTFGRLISNETINGKQATVNVSSYASGLYFAKIANDRQAVTVKFIKQ